MPIVFTDEGRGPVVVLVHGVGAGPRTFATVARLLAADHRTVVVERPVGPGGQALGLEEQADQIVAALEAAGATGARLVGVSGGATLALLIALRHPGVYRELLVHEPLLGWLAPALHERFVAASARAATGDAAALDVVRSVMGEPAWAALGRDERAEVEAAAGRWRHEIGFFASFDPGAEALATLVAKPVLTSVGARSGPERREAAAVLARLTGAEMAVVELAGNAPQIDAPEAFAALVSGWTPATVEAR